MCHCQDSYCGKKGEVTDLCAALHRTGLREVALDLVRTFGLEGGRRAANREEERLRARLRSM